MRRLRGTKISKEIRSTTTHILRHRAHLFYCHYSNNLVRKPQDRFGSYSEIAVDCSGAKRYTTTVALENIVY